MKVEIIAVGSELLTPFFLDTNSLYLARRLEELGFDLRWKTVVGDDSESLGQVLRTALGRAGLLFVMGGLGPTGDDLTRETLAGVLGRELRFDEAILESLQERFRRRGWTMSPSNRKQAEVIAGAVALLNRNGTAPGQFLEAGGCRVFLLPGPPAELEPMCEESVWPGLAGDTEAGLVRKVLKATGLGESSADELIRDLYPDQKDLRLTILSSPGQIEIHLSARYAGDRTRAEEAVNTLASAIAARLGGRVYSENGDDLEQVVGRLLATSRKTLAAAESCTGGLISERLTRVPGSSDYFLEGAVTYSNAAKTRVLGVPAGLIEAHGAVSAEVAEAMALGIRARSDADLGIAVTGIAGPGGATPEKPAGLVFTALAWDGGSRLERNHFFGRRPQVRFQASQKALDMVRIHLR
jgi:nicotinamide-nucleotide amidase